MTELLFRRPRFAHISTSGWSADVWVYGVIFEHNRLFWLTESLDGRTNLNSLELYAVNFKDFPKWEK